MEMDWKTTWASKAAGICCIIAGAVGIIGSIPLISKGIVLGMAGKIVESVIPFISEWLSSFGPVVVDIPAMISGGLGISSTVLMAIGAILASFGAVALIAGVFALNRKAWRFALVGSILAIASSPVLGIISIILVSLAKNEFKKS